jgi:hypothetical protein
MALTNVASGATKATKVLTANLQELTIFCAGQSKVGINVSAMTGSNTLTVYGSTDGLQFNPIQVGPYPEALNGPGYGPPVNGVNTLTSTGTWEVNVQNFLAIRVQLTTGNGPVSVIMAASVDGSYQEAFKLPQSNVNFNAVLFPSTTSSGGVNTCTIPAQANQTVNLTYCEVSQAGGGGGANAQLRIWDGPVGNGLPIYQCFLTAPVGSVGTVQELNLPRDSQGNRSIQASPGNQMTIQIVNLGNTFAIINGRASMI